MTTLCMYGLFLFVAAQAPPTRRKKSEVRRPRGGGPMAGARGAALRASQTSYICMASTYYNLLLCTTTTTQIIWGWGRIWKSVHKPLRYCNSIEEEFLRVRAPHIFWTLIVDMWGAGLSVAHFQVVIQSFCDRYLRSGGVHILLRVRKFGQSSRQIF